MTPSNASTASTATENMLMGSVVYYLVPKIPSWGMTWFKGEDKVVEWLTRRDLNQWIVVKSDMYGDRIVPLARNNRILEQLRDW